MNGQTHDAIVIGSGAGGSAAAWRLAAAGLRVLLLEKGGPLPADGSTLDVRRVVHDGAFLARESWRDGRGRPLAPEEHFNVGGKTRWYGAALLRFASDEFGADSALGTPGWPITAAELAPFYAEAERLLGVREIDAEPGLARIADALRRLGWRDAPLPMALKRSITWHPHEARHFDGFASVAGLKGDAESAFLKRAGETSRLRVVTDAEVVDLLGNALDRRRICGARLADGREFRARHVVLAAGALHSPRLVQRYLDGALLTGTIGAAVGRGLKLHHLTALVAVSVRRQDDWIRKTRVLTRAEFPHSTIQPLGFDAELIGSLVPKAVPRAIAKLVGRRAYGFFLQTEDGTHPDNRVHEIRTPQGVQRVLDYDAGRTPSTAEEHRALVAAFRRSLARIGYAGFAQPIGPNGTAHACGTLVAGRDPATSVVDAGGKVHGLDGLYVVDGSVLPRSSRVNPSLTIYAWALRVAALLVDREASLADRDRDAMLAGQMA